MQENKNLKHENQVLLRELVVSKDEVESLRKGLQDKIENNQAFQVLIADLNQSIKNLENEVANLKAQLYESTQAMSNVIEEMNKLMEQNPDSDEDCIVIHCPKLDKL